MSDWNVTFGRTAQIVVTVALLATVGSLIFIYRYEDPSTQNAPQWVDPFDLSDLTAMQKEFFRAVDRGDVRTVRQLLLEDASLAKVSIDPIGTPLHIAATRDMVDMARALLDAGADINAKGQWGGSPLHWAAYLGRVDTLRLLIDRGADIELRCTTYGSTPLLWASYGSASAQRWQYNRYRPRRPFGSDGGGTPDMEAERARRRLQRDTDYSDCVRSLIDAGADVNTKNREGVPAVSLAIPLVAKLLLEHGARNDYVPPVSPPENETPITPPADHTTPI